MKKAVLLSSVLLLSSCATIVSESDYFVNIGSEPKGAHFTIKNEYGMKVASGVTPSTVTLESGAGYFKKARYVISYNKESYNEKTYQLAPSLDNWYWGNFIFGGLIGMLIVDPISGAMYKFPATVGVSLSNKYEEDENSDEPKTISLNDLSPEQQQYLIRIN